MATIAEERAANARARAEGYESAAHKEMHANVGAQAAGYGNAVQQEIDANIRAQAAGFANAAEQEMDANRRSIDAGFTSAVDQEIDANRRAREAGFLNAADYESGLRTRSDAPFLDPRLQPAAPIPEQFRLGTANFPQYNVGPTAPRMPAARPIGAPTPGGLWGPPTQAGGGYGQFGEYLVPPQYTGPASIDPYVMQSSMGPGWDYQYPINPNGMIRGFGGGGPGGYPGGGYPGGGGGGILGPIGPGTGAGGGGNTTTDASGNQWVMSSDGQWVPAGSAYGQGLLGDARLFDPNFYDTSGGYIGSEGTSYEGGVEMNPAGQVQWGGNKSLPDWSDKWWGGLEKVGSLMGTAQNALASKIGIANNTPVSNTPTYVGDDPSFVDLGSVPAGPVAPQIMADLEAMLEPSVAIDMNTASSNTPF